MVEGDVEKQTRVIASALDAGVRAFDTAAKYGDGESETALGRALGILNPEGVIIASKVSVQGDVSQPEGIARACDESLRRLGRDHIDLYQVHNRIAPRGVDIELDGRLPTLSLDDFVAPGGVGDQLRGLRESGKIGAIGITAYGGVTDEIIRVIELGLLDSINVSFHMLNPSAGHDVVAGWPAYDHRRVGRFAKQRGLSVLGIRPLAGGYLAASSEDGLTPPPGARVPDRDVLWNAAVPGLIDEWCQTKECRPAELATSFSLASETVDSTVIGISEERHVVAIRRELERSLMTASEVEAWCSALGETVTGQDDG
jgi:aryl-alcohol dehydrogenase-like predicted oxidoreductase